MAFFPARSITEIYLKLCFLCATISAEIFTSNGDGFMVNSLKQTLIIAVCGAFFTVFVAFLMILRHAILSDYRQGVEVNDNKFAQILSQNVNYDIGRAFEIGQLAAEYPALANFTRAEQESLLKNMHNREPSYEWLALLDKDDKPLIVTDKNFADINKTKYEWYKTFRPDYEPEISPVYFSEKTKNLVVTFAEGIKVDGEVKGVLIGDINLTSLQKMIQQFNMESNCQAYLIDKAGTAIAQPDANDKVYNYKSMNYLTIAQNKEGYAEYDNEGRLIMRRASFSAPRGLCEAIFATLKGERGTTTYTDDKGNEYFCSYQPMDLPIVKTKWSIVIIHSTYEVTGMLDKVIFRAFIGGMFLIILSGLILSYFANKITKPILEMTAMANRVRDGDLSGQLDIQSDNEIGELADNINHMIKGLRVIHAKSKEAESRFKAIAYHDALTGLPNRNNFLIHLRQMLEKSVEGRLYGAMVFVDVDKFKTINDTYGHAVGDGVLIEFGKRLVEVVGSKECVCRYGGDEFLVFLPGRSEAEATVIAATLVNRMRDMFNIAGHEFQLSASLGLALMPKDSTDIDELLVKADAALYVSKRSGRDQFNLYEEGMATAPDKTGNDF